MKKRILAIVMLAFALSIAGPVLAEQTPQDQKAETKNLRKEIIRLKYVNASSVSRWK
ncbi:MAG: hypothetical protein MUQ25_07350 [Candidatus Aminicenantes bacterium]|nr:hypothetical protein [Candidatus Aminicenantes bacterium]